MTDRDPLRVRLFGYGVPYRVKFGPEGAVQPLETGPEKEAEDLARELAALAGLEAEEGPVEEGVWALSMPFGRCGVDGLPREYLKIFHQEEGYLDLLGAEGYEVVPLKEGERVKLTPGVVARVRARPRPGRRVVAAFQTEDHTPLLGNAAPFSLDGAVPDDYAERLIKCHAAFDRVKGMADSDRQGYREILDGFFRKMAAALEGDQKVSQTQKEARVQGTYDVPDQEVMFARQQGLLTAEVISRIRIREEGLFRFPGMFGGITTLFNLIE